MLSVMSFNIRGATYADGLNAWPQRCDLNVRTILRSRPDVIGFQEYQMGNHASYVERLSMYRFNLGKVYNRRERPFYNTIAWQKDKLKLVKADTFYLSQTPGTWSSSWDAARVHTATWAKLRHLASGQTILFVNTHLDHKSEWARQESSRLIVKMVDELNQEALPVVLLGDFNSSAEQAPRPDSVYAIYRTAGFADSWVAANENTTNTFHGFMGKAFDAANHPASLRLDWILLRNGRTNLTPFSCQIIRDAEPPLYPSDHYPVLAKLAL
jgi:endonuclease/exonuclease/phosphatase family metal-dependent hydrolase